MSADVFIIQNQDNLLLGKQRVWLDGREPGALFRSAHKDEAVNEMFEAGSRDYTQRLTLLTCPLNEKGVPVLDPAILPPPLPGKTRELEFEDDAAAVSVEASDATDNEAIEPADTNTAQTPGALYTAGE